MPAIYLLWDKPKDNSLPNLLKVHLSLKLLRKHLKAAELQQSGLAHADKQIIPANSAPAVGNLNPFRSLAGHAHAVP